MKTTAVRYHRHGSPEEVLQLEEIELEPLKANQVLLKMLAAPINPSDLGSISGSYGSLPPLPATAGREGIAEVVEAGADVSSPQPGDRVLAPGTGTWQRHLTAKASSLITVPGEIPLGQAAMASINPPTAFLLLNELTNHQPGEWVLQNAANSGVGHYVIEFARQRGLRTINLVRRPEWIDRLKSLGADEVFLENDDLSGKIGSICGDSPPRLALNSVGGPSAHQLLKCLAEGGKLITFGGMNTEPVRFPTRYLIFNDIRLTGFWLQRWMSRASRDEIAELYKQIFIHMADGRLNAPIEKEHRLEEFSAAVTRAASGGREGKILFRMD